MSLSVAGLLENLEGGLFTRYFERRRTEGSGTEGLSLWKLCEGNAASRTWREDSCTLDPE